MDARRLACLLVLLAATALPGCSRTSARLTPMNDPYYPELAAFEFAEERHGGRLPRRDPDPPTGELPPPPPPPRIGLALSGGGTRAAAFAMGVLRGLHEQGILQDTDIVSSVSGGGYAAYFYFTKLMALHQRGDQLDPRRGLGAIFADCLPRDYGRLCRGDGSCGPLGLDAELPLCGTPAHAMPGDPSDPFRYQGHVRGFQNVLSPYSTFRRDEANLERQEFDLLVSTVSSAPPYFLTNTLFDWERDLSGTKELYRRGIVRAYGVEPDRCAPLGPIRGSDDCVESRPVPNEAALHPTGEFRALRELWLSQWASDPARRPRLPCPPAAADAGLPRACKVPLWVINTTADYSKTALPVLDTDGKADIEVSAFEITPLGFRSRFYGGARGYKPWSLERPCTPAATSEPPCSPQELLRLDQAVAASGAFLDGNQRDYFRRYRGGLAFLANAFGLNWGTNVKNPHVDERVDRWHRGLPFPFYYAHRFEADEHAVDVHLADGGQTENTGLWALARRGVRHIVLVDAGFDRSGQLYDLCRVKWDLRQAGLALVLPSLEGFNGRYRDSLCYETLAFAEHGGTGDGKALDPHDRHGYPIHAWRNPVVEGCIVRIEPRQPYPEVPSTTAGARSPQDVFDEESPQRASCDGLVQSRLYLIKLAIDREPGPLEDAADACGPVVTGEVGPPRARQRCAAALRAAESGGPPLSAELVGYYAYERVQEEEKEDIAEDGRMRFPQHETVASTFDAYSERYGGYRELGRWYARHLELRPDGGVGSVAAGREHRQPLCLVRASGLLAVDCRSVGANPASGARG